MVLNPETDCELQLMDMTGTIDIKLADAPYDKSDDCRRAEPPVGRDTSHEA